MTSWGFKFMPLFYIRDSRIANDFWGKKLSAATVYKFISDDADTSTYGALNSGMHTLPVLRRDRSGSLLGYAYAVIGIGRSPQFVAFLRNSRTSSSVSCGNVSYQSPTA